MAGGREKKGQARRAGVSDFQEEFQENSARPRSRPKTPPPLMHINVGFAEEFIIAALKLRKGSNAMSRLVKSIGTALRLKGEGGVTAVEYGLIAALIAVVIITAVALVGTNLEAVFNAIATRLGTATGGGGGGGG
jgi:pilus assembly protein Flp/PilA